MKLHRIATVVALSASVAVGQQMSVVDSPHNLSAIGPGAVRAASEEQVCIFCHAPHNAMPMRPLWNRATPIDGYLIYTSRSLDAEPGQPTGTSKMCLSCHDGTIALGSVASRDFPIMMAGSVAAIPEGASRLGTDLRDDHPVSFVYDRRLAAADPRIRDPLLIPHEITLDANGELQCTSCHDAHDNVFGNFLVMSNSGSQLCMSCHQVGQTSIGAHTDCNACHQPHTAPSGPYLLRGATIAETCLQCHDGSVSGAANIEGDLRKTFIHETHSPVDPGGEPMEHASCADCHEPHTMGRGTAAAPGLHPNLGLISGVSGSGSPLELATAEFEVCFKCHADDNRIRPWVERDIAQNNTRLEFAPGAVSFHPVQSPGRNSLVPSLKPELTPASVIHCSDCHASDSGSSGGGFGPGGVHGSRHGPLLVASYSTADYTSESAQSYALCYSCHDRSSILGNESFSGHKRHIVDHRASCATCHDAHGIASYQGSTMNNSHLINFATGIVLPDPATGRLEFIDNGTFTGTCFLECHNAVHSGRRYPE